MFRLLAVVFSLLLPLVASTASAADKPVIAAVNYPLAYFAERLGGDAVEVLFPVPANRDPAFWRPSLADIAAIQKADVIALNGAGYAAWTTKVSLPRSRLVDTSAPFKSDYIRTESITHSHGEDGEHSHEGVASHTWLNFSNAARQADTLAAAMKRRLPDLAAAIDTASVEMMADLDALDMIAREAAAKLGGAPIITTHPRYQYLGAAYQLNIHSLEWEAGAPPTDAQWDQLSALMSKTGASILIWEAAPPAAARAKASAMGLRDIVLPTLANRPEDGDFISAMRKGLADLAALGS